jgi:hypothetical protein
LLIVLLGVLGRRRRTMRPLLLIGLAAVAVPSLAWSVFLTATDPGLYLWHWPLLVAAQAQFGELSPMAGLAAVLAAAVPAIITYKLVENPLRRSEALTSYPVRAIQLGAVCTVFPAVGGLLLYYAVWPAIQPAPPLARDSGVTGAATSAPTAAGAGVLGQNPRGDRAGAAVDRVSSLWPDPSSVRADLPDAYRDGCVPTGTISELKPCEYGVRDAATTVVLAGDSHAGHWLPALEAIADQKGWRLVVYLRNSCPFLDVEVALPHSNQPCTDCTEWNRELRSVLTGPQRPDLLLTSSTLYQPIRAGKALVGKPARRLRSRACGTPGRSWPAPASRWRSCARPRSPAWTWPNVCPGIASSSPNAPSRGKTRWPASGLCRSRPRPDWAALR